MSSNIPAAELAGRRHWLADSIYLRAIEPNGMVLCVIFAYSLAVLVLGFLFDFPVNLGLYGSFVYRFIPGSLALVLLFACVVVLIRHRPSKPTAFIRDKIVGEWKIGRRLLLGMPIFIATPVMFSAFTSFKAAIGSLVPFYADPYLGTLDQ